MTRIEEVLNRYVFWTDDLLEETRKEILRELERATESAENTRLVEENISLRADVQILRNQLVKKHDALAFIVSEFGHNKHESCNCLSCRALRQAEEALSDD